MGLSHVPLPASPLSGEGPIEILPVCAELSPPLRSGGLGGVSHVSSQLPPCQGEETIEILINITELFPPL